MSKVFGLNKPNTKLRKNVFDLSEKNTFTTSAGLLVPALCKELNPGEKIKLSAHGIVRTLPLNTAAFVRLRQYYHYFFVPYRQLWSGWDNFINGVNYRVSANQSGKDYNSVPYLDILGIISELLKAGYISQYYNVASDKIQNVGGNVSSGVSYRGFGRSSFGAEAGVRPLGGANSSSRGHRNSTSRSEVYNETVVKNNAKIKTLDEMGYYYIQGISRLLDMLGYGFSYVATDDTGKSYRKASTLIEILDELAKNDIKVTEWLESEKNQFKVNPFRLLAYQKIYNDFYKRDDYEATDPLVFNIDDISGDFSKGVGDILNSVYRSNGNDVNLKRLLGILRLRYRWQSKDYFTGVVPSQLMFENLNKFSINDIAPGTNISIDMSKAGGQVYSTGTLSTNGIRAMFALEKIQRLNRRAGGYDYISQTMAHYGFEPPKGRGDKVEFIGGTHAPINISEVLTTADTDRGFTGRISGRGFGEIDNNGDVEYQAKEHGILMCITSVVPDSDYSAEGLDPFNCKFQRGDYFHPELQDLGLQPVMSYEFQNLLFAPDVTDTTYPTSRTPIGFVPRYAEYKSSFDKLHGEFRNGRFLSAWSSVSNLNITNTGVAVNTLKIDPAVLNRIFVLAYDGSEETDQFMCRTQFICKVIRPMSISGQQL